MSKIVIQKKPRSPRTTSHMPRLDTIEMVEKIIAEQKDSSSKNKLWRALPKQVQYKTFTTILNYLVKSNKIMYDKKGAILWIFVDNQKLKKLHRQSKVLR
ncbi:MAG: hypothetical protein ACREA7_05870 [Nitrosotalea sp.]